MIQMNRTILAAAALGWLSGAVLAGPVSDFESQLRGTYAQYRAALFMTNTGKAGEAGKAMAAFADSWAAISKDFKANPPPQYADDAQWAATLDDVAARAAKAKEEIAAGELPKAHETLEGVRDAVGGLHERNGIVSFSDRMNAYHVVMEKVLGAASSDMDVDQVGAMREQAAVLVYLAQAAVAHPPPEAAGNPDFAKLSDAMLNATQDVLGALRSGDKQKIKPALGALKPAYSKLFVKFG
jgi:hypothetical protein